MLMIKPTDSTLKLLNSILFRAIMLSYGLSLLISFNNILSVWWYFGATILYIGVYIILFNKKGYKSLIRLINDYAFITLISYGKPFYEIHCGIFILLPVINVLNHSGEKAVIPFSLRLYVLVLLSTLVLNDFKFDWVFVVPLVAISFINFLVYFRMTIIGYSNNLNSIIEEFYQENLSIGKTHLILKKVIKRHENNKLLSKYISVSSILLFQLKDNGYLKILLSSNFIVSFKLIDIKGFANQIQKQKQLSNLEMVLDDRISKHNLFILNEHQGKKYIFFVEFAKPPVLDWIMTAYQTKILLPLLSKISQVVYMEYQLEQERKKYFGELKTRLENIDSAVNAIHYLNNKLSPVLNYLEMLRLYPETDKALQSDLLVLIEREKGNAINNIIPITNKMNQMAEKSMNANIISDTTNIRFRKLFTLIRGVFDDNNTIDFELKVDWDEHIFNHSITSNINLLTFIFDEILINLEKHSTGSCNIEFLVANFPIIKFTNTVKNIERNKQALSKMVEDFNKDTINEIMKRGSNGLRIIKQYLMQLSIDHSMSILNDQLTLTLTIKPESNENPNI